MEEGEDKVVVKVPGVGDEDGRDEDRGSADDAAAALDVEGRQVGG